VNISPHPLEVNTAVLFESPRLCDAYEQNLGDATVRWWYDPTMINGGMEIPVSGENVALAVRHQLLKGCCGK